MKQLVLFSAFLFFFLPLRAQQGVAFRPLSFQEALEVAGKEGKPLFIDCSTSWCGACRTMFKQVFPTREAGNYFNPRFICLKFDMEKGEGPELGKKFDIHAYPTFLIVGKDGKEIYRIVGGDDLKSFIRRLDRGMDGSSSLERLEKTYAGGRASKEELMQYYTTLSDAGNSERAGEIHRELAGKLTVKDKLKSCFWPFFAQAEYGSPDFDFILSHEKEMKRHSGNEVVEGKVFDGLAWAVRSIMYGTLPQEEILEIKASVDACENTGKSMLLLYYDMALATLRADVEGLVSMLDKHMDRLETPYFHIVGLAMQKMREKGLPKEDYAALAAVCTRMLGIFHIDDNISKLKEWRNMFSYRSAREVYFEESSLPEALELSRIYSNYTLVYCHRPSCKDCSAFSRDVLQAEQVGTFINRRFRCIRMDLDGNSGFTDRYRIDSCPVLLVLDSDGSEKFRITGIRTPDVLVQELEKELSRLPRKSSPF